MKSILCTILLFAMYQSMSAQIPFSTIAQVYNFDIGDTLEYSCDALNALGSNCDIMYGMMDVVINKNSLPDSIVYTFREISYVNYNNCGPASGSADTTTQIITNLDSSVFWYHNPALYAYGNDTTATYLDSVRLDSTMYYRKRDEHWEGLWICCMHDTAYADGLGKIVYTYGSEDNTEPQGGCTLAYYHKATGEFWGTRQYFDLHHTPIGIPDITAGDGINLFPNPSQGILNITSTGPTITGIELYNITGALLRTLNRPQDMPVDIYDVAPGVYYARITTTQGITVRRWVKL